MSTKITSFTNRVIWCAVFAFVRVSLQEKKKLYRLGRTVGRYSVMDWKHGPIDSDIAVEKNDERERGRKRRQQEKSFIRFGRRLQCGLRLQLHALTNTRQTFKRFHLIPLPAPHQFTSIFSRFAHDVFVSVVFFTMNKFDLFKLKIRHFFVSQLPFKKKKKHSQTE